MTEEKENNMAALPEDVRRAITDYRRMLTALPAEQKEAVRDALAGKATPDNLPGEILDTLDALKGLWNTAGAAREELQAALDAGQAVRLTPEDFTGETQTVILDALDKLEDTDKAAVAAALKTGNDADLTEDCRKTYTLVAFYIGIAEDAARRRLADIFGLSQNELQAIHKSGKQTLSDDKQLLLPFEGMQRVFVRMTQGRHSKNVSMPISKLAQIASRLPIGEEIPIGVIPASKKQASVGITVFIDIPQEVTVNRKITYFDRMVEDAIGNLADDGYIDANGVMAITPEMVLRQMQGQSNARNVSGVTVRQVNESIEKLAKTWCKPNCTEHLKTVGGKMTMDLQEAILGRNIIVGTQVYLKFKDGREEIGWKIMGRPLIYEYSKGIAEIAPIERRVLQAGKISNTPEVMQMRYYLLQQIERIRKGRTPQGDAPNVLYDSMFNTIGDALPNEKTSIGRKTRTNRIKAIKAILDGFKEAGHIVDWREAGTGNRGQHTGVKIEANPRSGRPKNR